MKLPARIFSPLLVLLTFGNILFLFSFFKFEKRIWYYLISFPVIISLLSIPQYSKANSFIISSYKKFGKINQMMFDDMNSNFSNTIFIPTNIRAWDIHCATDPINEITLKNKNCYVYLTIEGSVTPETQDQLISKFGTNDHSKLFNKISEMNNVIFISEDNYNRFIKSYYHYLYNQDYYFEKDSVVSSSLNKYTGLNYYRFKKGTYDYSLFNNQGVNFFKSKQYEKAIESFEKAIKIAPQNISVLTNLAVTYNAIGKTEKAAEYLKKAEEIKKNQKDKT